MTKIQADAITCIDNGGIKYISNTGKEEELRFEQCNENYKKQQLGREGMKQDDMYAIGKSKCVGVRDIIAKPPFIGLYSEPRCKIEFESEEEFSIYRNKIHDFGWTTLDLS
ncbi:hypothetical protein ACFCP7_17625 [Paenibacillus elgii]